MESDPALVLGNFSISMALWPCSIAFCNEFLEAKSAWIWELTGGVLVGKSPKSLLVSIGVTAGDSTAQTGEFIVGHPPYQRLFRLVP